MPAAAKPRRVVIEADGGSRGNPGPAAYGAVLKDADTGALIAEAAEPIGTATNNVAEYRGLIAGLELALEHAPDAEVEVRMDSKLAIEQMAGRWKIKHRGLQPLAAQAQQLASRVVGWTWVPRERNLYADRLLNEALDGGRRHRAVATPEPEVAKDQRGLGAMGPPTTLLVMTAGDPRQVAAAVDSLAAQPRAAAVVASPLPPAREAGQVVADRLDVPLVIDPDVGDEVADADEPLRGLAQRVRQARDRLLRDRRGETVVVVAPAGWIAMLVAVALDAPLSSAHRIQPAPGSVSVIRWTPGGAPTLQQFAVSPEPKC